MNRRQIHNRHRTNPGRKIKITRRANRKKTAFGNNKNKGDEVNPFKRGIECINGRSGFVYNFLWSLLIFSSALTCCYQTYDRLSFFLSHPIDTKVSIFRNSSVKFPSITLCPFVNNYRDLLEMRNQNAKARNRQHLCDESHFTLLSDNLNISTIWDLMNINGTLLSTYMHMKSIYLLAFGGIREDQDHSLVSLKNDTKTIGGTCNVYSIKKLVRFEKNNLQFLIILNPTSPFFCNKQADAVFALHNDDDIMTYKVASESKKLPLNNKVLIGLSAKRFKVLNETRNPCDTTQVVSECERNCFEMAVKNISRCRLPMTLVSDMPLCRNETDAVQTFYRLLGKAASFNYLANCNCPKVCDEIVYTDHFKDIEQYNFSVLSIYFDDNVIEEIEDYYCYSFISFICDFGGNLGLFLGLSIPAIFQLGESVTLHILRKTHP